MTKSQDANQPIDYDLLDDLTGYALRRAQLHVFHDFIKVMEPWGIRPAEFSGMVLISANPGLSQTRLAGALNIERASLVRMIDKLGERDFVLRKVATEDRRAHEIYLTENGEKALVEMKRQARRHEREITENLSQPARKTLIASLHRLYEPPVPSSEDT